MQSIDFDNAHYIKLGSGGKWEDSSIHEHKIRIGWDGWTAEEINGKDWEGIRKKYEHGYKNKGSATADINALKTIVESTSDDIWITFHAGQLWWCRVGEAGIFKDEISKYRNVAGQWHNTNIAGRPLLINQIPGSISKTQGFRATVCTVGDADALRRLLNNQPSGAFQAISAASERLREEVESGLKGLHWKDFEILVDLIFRNAGWRRVSVIGETMKLVDMEMEEPVTGALYQIQVKSAATLDEFQEYTHECPSGIFRKYYFVVHSPKGALATYCNGIREDVELILPEKLARMVVEFGLTDWLLKKIK